MVSTLELLCFPVAFRDVLSHLLILKRSDSQRSINVVMDGTSLEGQIVSPSQIAYHIHVINGL